MPVDDARFDAAYLRCGVPVDQLAYTSHLDAICADVGLGLTDANRKELLDRALYRRKRGLLPKLGRTAQLGRDKE